MDWHKHTRANVTGAGLIGFGLMVLMATATVGAEPAEGEVEMATTSPNTAGVQVTVSEIDAQGELLRVAVNKAVLLRFNYPVNEVRLVKPEIAEVTAASPYQLVVTGKSFGMTQLIVRLNGSMHKVFDIAVDVELERVLASIRTAVPRAKVQVYSLRDTVVLTGTAPDTASAEKIVQIAEIFADKVVNHLEIAGSQQVLLRCTVAEMNRSASRQLGFNGWIAGDNAPSAFGVSNVGGINPSNIGAVGGAIVSPPQALGGTTAAASGGIVPFTIGDDGIPVQASTTLSVGFPQVPMQIFVRALRENGLLKILAEPNLVAISGQEASFLAGGSVPIPVPQDGDTITIQYREYGVRLNFTPAVLSEGRIRLNVTPEVSEPDTSNALQIQGFFVPGFIERRVQTVVEVGSGQTIAIGGLLSETVRSASTRVPGLGDMPVLGPLFRSVEYQKSETELVVLITPELVGPISPQQVTYLPGEHSYAPNDFELFMLGELEGATPGAQPRLQPRVNGTWQSPATDEAYSAADSLKLRGPIGPAGPAEGM